MNELYRVVNQNRIDYAEIRALSKINLLSDGECDINVIIGFQGRYNFLDTTIRTFKEAIRYYFDNKTESNKFTNILLTFVEHDIAPYSEERLIGDVNYIYTPGNVRAIYSRSFAYNFGVKYSNKAKYYLLHDLDIVVKKDFFLRLERNLTPEVQCLQPFGGRCVLYVNPLWTERLLETTLDHNELENNPPWVSEPELKGSKGGSILITGEAFSRVGGFDPEIFWGYAVEDQMFWSKVLDEIGHIEYADNPHIDVFHMYHEPVWDSNPLEGAMREVWHYYQSLSLEDRLAFLKYKSDLFKNG